MLVRCMELQDKYEGKRFVCDFCDYKATRPDRLKRHVRVSHEGLEYKCSDCSYKTPIRKYLEQHQLTNHTMGKLFCEFCDYETIFIKKLETHSMVKHEGFRYECDGCIFKGKLFVRNGSGPKENWPNTPQECITNALEGSEGKGEEKRRLRNYARKHFLLPRN